MVRDLRLAHFLPDFCHECFVELATEYGVLPMFAMFSRPSWSCSIKLSTMSYNAHLAPRFL